MAARATHAVAQTHADVQQSGQQACQQQQGQAIRRPHHKWHGVSIPRRQHKPQHRPHHRRLHRFFRIRPQRNACEHEDGQKVEIAVAPRVAALTKEMLKLMFESCVGKLIYCNENWNMTLLGRQK